MTPEELSILVLRVDAMDERLVSLERFVKEVEEDLSTLEDRMGNNPTIDCESMQNDIRSILSRLEDMEFDQ